MPANSLTGMAMLYGFIAGQAGADSAFHSLSPASKEKPCISLARNVKPTFNKVSLARRSSTSLGIERHCIHCSMPQPATRVRAPPLTTPNKDINGGNQPAPRPPPLIPPMSKPRSNTIRNKSKRKPQGLGVPLSTPPSVPYE